MRRIFSISLILLLWLGPLAAVLPGIDESRLPFCCRRHGAHHCAMDGETAQSGSSGPAVSAGSRCPEFPGTLAATILPQFVASFGAPHEPTSASGLHSSGATRRAARAGQLRIQTDRGPPPLAIA